MRDVELMVGRELAGSDVDGGVRMEPSGGSRAGRGLGSNLTVSGVVDTVHGRRETVNG